MLWFLTLHIAALLFWLAGLLYLPILLSGVAKSRTEIADTPYQHDSIGRASFSPTSPRRRRYWPLLPERSCSCLTATSNPG